MQDSADKIQEKANGAAAPVKIRKASMIRKNLKDIKDVYKIAKKTIGTGAYGVVSLC